MHIEYQRNEAVITKIIHEPGQKAKKATQSYPSINAAKRKMRELQKEFSKYPRKFTVKRG